jgi:tRNA(His) 5'-end guanylyltransferase
MIWYVLIFGIAVLLVVLMKKSSSKFFLQSREKLAVRRQRLIHVLEDFAIDTEKEKIWLEAFDAFRDYPKMFKYDGRTILADLHTISNYDASAGNHDYRYQLLNNTGFWNYLKGKLKADYEFGNDMRKLKIPWMTTWTAVFLLILSTPFWIGYVGYKGKLKKNIN